MSQDQIFQLGLLFLLIFMSAFFSGTETAFFSINKIRMRHLAENGDKKAYAVVKLLDSPSRLISTILIGNNIVNISASAIATSLAIDIFGNVGVGIATGTMTILVLFFGEITPKTFATKNAELVAVKVVDTITLLSRLFSPIIRVFTWVNNYLLKVLGGTGEETPDITEEELRMLVTLGHEEGFIAESEREMIDSIFEFDDTVVREVMIPRIDMIAVDIKQDMEAFIKLIVEAGHSRIPVYKGTIDNIVGLLYVKDLLKYLARNSINLPEIKDIIRPAFYVPESRKLRDLMADLRREKVHMAIVVDEYGGTAGLITFEDLIEEIIGDIQDEYDKEERLWEWLEDGSFRFDARTSIYDLNEALDASFSDQEFDTVGGMILHNLGQIPNEGQKLSIDGFNVLVEKKVARRITKVRIWPRKLEEE